MSELQLLLSPPRGQCTHRDMTCVEVGAQTHGRISRGYFWDNHILMQRHTDPVGGTIECIVVPKARRKQILHQIHDQMGHLGHRKIVTIIKRIFVWRLLHKEARLYCESCPLCQKQNKGGQRCHPMIERQVITQPFETIAFDIVGPLPKGKGGANFILPELCMATRWPEAVALKSIMAKSIAEAMVGIFSRTSIPYQILTDRGTQFMEGLAKHLYEMLGIEHLRMSPYHPQSNGALERLHSTLEGILAKARISGLDWVTQLPFVLFALRQSPNRTTGFSPYELLYGYNVRAPLELVYEGWRGCVGVGLNVVDWISELGERLEALREVAARNGLLESEKRKSYYNKRTVAQEFVEGKKVLCRTPGLLGKLEDAWQGPFTILKRVCAVNYILHWGKGKKKQKVVHVNRLKKFQERELEICALTVVADDQGLEDDLVRLKEDQCDGYKEQELLEVLSECREVLNESPGETKVKKER